jgi:putative membrane protein
MLQPVLQKNDKKARTLILIFSAIVFIAVAALSRVRLDVDLGFDPHIFATANAVINFMVTILLIAGFIAVKKGNYQLHKKIMMTAMVLSVLFLVSYIAHHLFAGETVYGDLDHSGGKLSEEEKAAAGPLRIVYYVILATHIPLAGIILPFILFTAYRALVAEWPSHKKLARITWPIWLYVAITGVLVYLMISPYY